MKKLIIGLLLAVNVFLLTITTVKADFVTNDYFLNNDLYLFSYDIDFTNPNFENGYISKRNITYSDIEEDSNNYFYSWYRQLGIDLIYDYVNSGGTDENFFMAIKLNNITASTFQIAYSVDSPYDANYILMYNDGTYLRVSASNNGYTSILIPPETQSNKIATYFLWDVYQPDYISSFKTLTNQDSYNLGYNAGENSGFNSGYNSGYSSGYYAGYNAVNETGTATLMNYNQLAHELTSAYWNSANANIIFNNEIVEFTATAQYGRLYTDDIRIRNGHKYLLNAMIKTTAPANQIYLRLAYATAYLYNIATPDYQIIRGFTTANSTTNATLTLYDDRSSNFDVIYVKNIYIMDLTEIYGQGNEPETIEEFNEMFPSSYYEYSEGEVIGINYFVGYENGKNEGYQIGYNEAQTTQVLSDGYGWIRNIFRGMGDFLAIQILPNITIGLIIGIPFIISVAWFVIRAFRGGGGE